LINRKKRWRVLVTGSIVDAAKDMLSRYADVIEIPLYTSQAELIEAIQKNNIDAILVRGGTIDAAAIKASKSLKVIATHGSGFNSVDVHTASELGIPVVVNRTANFEAVAEHAVGLLYALAKKISLLNNKMRNDQFWDRSSLHTFELKNKSIGIIGMGKSGLRVTEILGPLEMVVFGYDPYIDRDDIPNRIKHVDTLEMLLVASDIISIHCHLNEETFHLLSDREFSIMKVGAIIINTARGEIIDERSLISALENGKIGGAALDVFENEPPDFGSRLFEFDNVVVTPHIAGGTIEAFQRSGIMAADKILKVLLGKEGDIEKDAFV
jgi:D-3-phosphoglycerate dehydrogenase